MSSVNMVILVGHLGKDPEVRYTAGGDAITTLSLATTETWKDKAGAKQEKTEWTRCVFFGKGGEVIAEHARKGSLLFVEGKLSTRKWTDKQEQTRYSTEVIGGRFQFLGGGKREPEREEPASAPTKQRDPGGFDEMGDDIPF